MMKFILRIFCLILSAILGSACGIGASEYGMPHANYKLDGKVIAAKDKKPIKGIQINFNSIPVVSDLGGLWKIDTSDTSMFCSDFCSLQIEDIDGENNGGTFEKLVVPISPEQTKEGEGWDHGTFELHNITIELALAPSAKADGGVDGTSADLSVSDTINGDSTDK